MTPIIIEHNKAKLVRGVFMCIVLMAICVWLLTESSRATSKVLGGVGGICGVLALYFYVTRLRDRTPAVQVDDEGIRVGGQVAGPIAWSDVIGIGRATRQKDDVVTIQVRDPQAYVEGAAKAVQPFITANIDATGAPVVISTKTLSVSTQDLMDQVGRAFLDQTARGRTAISPRG